MTISEELQEVLAEAVSLAVEHKYEYLTPELILYALTENEWFNQAFRWCGGDPKEFRADLRSYMDDNLKQENLQIEGSGDLEYSGDMQIVLNTAIQTALNSGKNVVELDNLVYGFRELQESYALYYMEKQGVDVPELVAALVDMLGTDDGVDADDENGEEQKTRQFEQFAPCLNEQAEQMNPLIGREAELERTIQILCRKEKNNPLHLGEPGVGKTAITYGLAQKINRGEVPEPLKGAKIYGLDLGSLLAGTQYRGELEKRLKNLLEEIRKEEKPIIYIDEIHNMAGAGAVGEGSFDASNMLNPYLSSGRIRFIGATTYEEYKKYFEKNKSLVRRFQNVEIPEPSVEETVEILEGLRKKYEQFHGVRYGKGVLEYAVRMSQKYMNERFLPDKAIDLMDEAGAYRRIHPLEQKRQTVGKEIINEILTGICRVPVEAAKQETGDVKALAALEKRLKEKVFGQDEAVSQVVNAIKFSRAGLQEDHKPLSSFLFVGPTGVGKTEIAKVLSRELGIRLVRFDMSEYTEKHTVAKLIGSPAGYVGYEEGGLLTESIRKNPSCVLLLDEIEKAHPDIFNVLLQVMDYATLTDNQGRKADFRNVILIMTSNAGASRLGKMSLGFGSGDTTPDVIAEEVKRVFQPEFRNRLNKIVVFHSMDEQMGARIAGKKLEELAAMLQQKKVVMTWTREAAALLKEKGTSREFGAREMDRIIQDQIKPLLVDELLFGKLRRGGSVVLEIKDRSFVMSRN